MHNTHTLRLLRTALPLLLLGTLLSISTANAQYYHLGKIGERDAFYLNLDRIFNYNLYEHTRWGLGLRHTHDFGTKRADRPFLLSTDIYGAYGIYDERFKGGAKMDLQLPTYWHTHIYLEAFDDLDAAASRNLDGFQIAQFGNSNSFMTRRFTHTRRATLGTSWDYKQRTICRLQVSLSKETPLFNFSSLMYYRDGYTRDILGYELILEGRAAMELKDSRGRWNAKAEMTAGYALESQRPILRLITQYSTTLPFSAFEFELFAQAGATPPKTPYIRMFDLGGSYGSFYAFRRTLLTAAPNEFSGNMFAFVSAYLTTRKPLFNYDSRLFQLGTHPKPFLQVNVAWSHLWDQDADGYYYLVEQPVGNSPRLDLDMQSLNYGIAEVAAGINGAIRWGIVDWGITGALRLVPEAASYNQTGKAANLLLLLNATLAL